MNKMIEIVAVDKPEESVWGIVGSGVHAYNIDQAGESGFQRLCFALQGADEEVVGGVLGEVYWNWLYVDLLWVKEDFRHQGYGSRLMARLEEAAKQHGAKRAYLDTFSFQAPDFYEKLDYRVFGELPDFPQGQVRFFMTKKL